VGSFILKTIKFLSWNCKGFGNNMKVEALRDLINIEKPSMILFQETKMEETVALISGGKAM